jgi:hypothetical protein
MSNFDHKKYYEEHKDKIKQQIKVAMERRRLHIIIERLNNGSYKRLPFSKLSKYHIIKDENGIYKIQDI